MSELIRREDLENWLRTECASIDTYEDKEYVIGRLREDLPTVNQWHRVEEELPKQGEWVLVKSCLVRMRTDFIDKTGRWYYTPGVTHWMPLPESPNEVQE